MGFTLYANGSTMNFDGGMGGFFSLRTNIALAFDKEFGEHYSDLRKCLYEEDYKLFDQVTEKILSNERFKQEDEDIVEFLFASEPSADVVEVKHGKWEVTEHNAHLNVVCSNCNEDFYVYKKGQYRIDRSNYCPKCGARMDGKEGEVKAE